MTELAEHTIELRRERLSFTPSIEESSDAKETFFLSNRIVLPLKTGDHTEQFVIRAQSVHLCLKTAALIAQEFRKRGPIQNRSPKFNWDELWGKVISGYEYKWNFNRWVRIYCEGQPVFEKGPGKIPQQLDLLEEIIFNVRENYKMALSTFHAKVSKDRDDVVVNHKSSLALKAEIKNNTLRCSMQCRSANNSSIITMIATEPKTGTTFDQFTCLSLFSDFKQGFQYSHLLGLLKKQIKSENDKDTENQIRELEEEIRNIERRIHTLEGKCKVHYRPEKPDFSHLALQAERQ